MVGDQALPCAWDRGTRRTNYLRHVPEIVAHGEFIPTPSGSGHAVFLLFCAVYLDKHTANSAFAVPVAAVGASPWATLGEYFAV